MLERTYVRPVTLHLTSDDLVVQRTSSVNDIKLVRRCFHVRNEQLIN